MYYTPGQVQEMLDIPASTLRYYSKRFDQFITPKGNRKHRLYSDQDLTTLKVIRDLAASGMTYELIVQKINVAPPPEINQPVETSLSLVPTIAAEIANAQETARSALSQLAEIRKTVENQNQQLAQLENRLRVLDNYFALPWYKRLFSKRPRP